MRIEGSSRRSASHSVSASSSGCANPDDRPAMAAAIIRGVRTPTAQTPTPITIGGREFRWGERTYVVGIVNVTPDSFSGDGLGDNVDAAIRQAVHMCEDGADIIDIGGESTRPGFAEVPAHELDVPISIDTYKTEVAKEAIKAGATLVNAVHGFLRDLEIARVAAEAGIPAIAMYNHRG